MQQIVGIPKEDAREIVASGENSTSPAAVNADPLEFAPALYSNTDQIDVASLNGREIRPNYQFDNHVVETTFFRAQTLDADGKDVTFEGYSPLLLPDRIAQLGFETIPKVTTTQFVVPLSFKGAATVELLLFENDNSITEAVSVPMREAGSFEYTGARRFTVAVEGLQTGACYAFRINGGKQHQVPHRWVVDPMSKLTVPGMFLGKREGKATDCTPDGYAPPKSVVVDVAELRRTVHTISPLNNPPHPRDMSIFQAHVAVTSTIPDSLLEPEFRGTQGTLKCLGSSVVINHLKSLGINAIQVMPLQARSPESKFDNVWGYICDSLFGLDRNKLNSGNGTPEEMFKELRSTISRFHEAGIAFILDIVTGHTSENCDPNQYTSRGGHLGRDKRDDAGVQFGSNHSFRVIDPEAYLRDPSGNPLDLTNCGHTVNFTGLRGWDLMRRLLSHWVETVGIKKYRWDQGSVAGRTQYGNFDPNSLALQLLEEYAKLPGVTMIVEPSDAGFAENGDSTVFTGFHCFEGQFPQSITEQRLSFAHKARQFFKHQGEYHVPGVGATTIRALADACRSSDGVHFAGVHDGMTVKDNSREITRYLRSRPAPGERRRVNVEEGKLEWLVNRALLASSKLVPGAHLLFQGDEFGKSNNGNHDAFQLMESVIGNWSPTEEEAELLRFNQRLAELKGNLMALNHEESPRSQRITSNPVSQFVSSDGCLVELDYFERRDHKPVSLFEREAQSVFGVLYTRNQGGLQGFRLNSEGLPAPVLVARANDIANFMLPDLGPSYYWSKVFDSTQTDAFFESKVPYYVGRQCEPISGPGVVVYTARRLDRERP